MIILQVATIYPETQGKNPQKLATNSIDNMGVKELLIYLRKCNAVRNLGEFNEQVIEWIWEREAYFLPKIANIYKVGNHKVKLTYYGMIFTILKYTGFYLRGKSNVPVSISCTKYQYLLKLNKKISNNARKSIKEQFYKHNYMLCIARRKSGEIFKVLDPTLEKLETVFEELAKDICRSFLNYK